MYSDNFMYTSFIYDELKLLDVMALGKEQAINLG